MSGHQPPLTCDEFKDILRKMGFKPRPRKGTSHEQWVGEVGGVFRKVTVDCPKAPFSQSLIGSMAKQAGVTKKIIYDFHFGRRDCL
jgi:predicted RNA binding protein YcfA (HicA-like mRNA interferase family)